MHNILILATGGTIASDATENGLAPELTAADIVSGSLHNLPDCRIDCRDILALDSSNIQPEEWQIIAREVAASWENYDGIVITHGTDTMAYTASALSYMLRTSPSRWCSPAVSCPSSIPLPTPPTTSAAPWPWP